MSYYFSKTVNMGFDEAVEKVTKNLKLEGFGVLTQIDVKETLKNKLNVDFKRYLILGACNPPYAYKALQSEDKIGAMLPCNVVVIDQGNGQTEISAVDPVASMMAVTNRGLASVAQEISGKLQKVIGSI
jgi:uncharacterized protein (DUF302 family)